MLNGFKILPLLIAATEVARGIQTNQKNQDACSSIQTLLMSSERCQYFSIKFIMALVKTTELNKIGNNICTIRKKPQGSVVKKIQNLS